MKTVKDLYKLNLTDLLTELMTSTEPVSWSELEMINYIKEKTDNFKPDLLTTFSADMSFFYSELISTTEVSKLIHYSSFDDQITLIELLLQDIAEENNLKVSTGHLKNYDNEIINYYITVRRNFTIIKVDQRALSPEH